ncbi:unnamed protein product, partial [Adineta steineri]
MLEQLRDGTICKQYALGWESCNTTVPCDTVRDLICTLDICECDATVNLSCPSTNTGRNCQAGHCICPRNMVWNNPTSNTCACSGGTVWSSGS